MRQAEKHLRIYFGRIFCLDIFKYSVLNFISHFIQLIRKFIIILKKHFFRQQMSEWGQTETNEKRKPFKSNTDSSKMSQYLESNNRNQVPSEPFSVIVYSLTTDSQETPGPSTSSNQSQVSINFHKQGT